MKLDAYSRKTFETASETELPGLCRGLAEQLADTLSDAGDWTKVGTDYAKKLRKLGHALESADEDDEFQAWCGGALKSSRCDGELRLFIHCSGGVEVTWRDGGANYSADVAG